MKLFKFQKSFIINNEKEITPIIFQPPPPSDWGNFGDETVRVTNISQVCLIFVQISD